MFDVFILFIFLGTLLVAEYFKTEATSVQCDVELVGVGKYGWYILQPQSTGL